MNQNKHWTQAQIKRLDTIIGRLEALQNDVEGKDDARDLSRAKTALFDALRKAENS